LAKMARFVAAATGEPTLSPSPVEMAPSPPRECDMFFDAGYESEDTKTFDRGRQWQRRSQHTHTHTHTHTHV
jgi:hypothetical protein